MTGPRRDAVAVTENASTADHVGEPHTWCMPPRPEIVCRDVTGRRNLNGGTTWLVLPCNRWPCKAVRLVRVRSILAMAGRRPMTGALADRIRAHAATSTRPGQLRQLEEIADEVAEVTHERDDLRAKVATVLAAHQPYRTVYREADICTTCSRGHDGDVLWPCPTAVTLDGDR